MDTMIKIFRNTGLIIMALNLAACASPPRTVDASLPLVESNSFVSNEIVPSEYWSTLSDAENNEFSHNSYLIKLSPPYDSALGTQCRLMRFFDDSSEAFLGSRIACVELEETDNSLWFLTNNVSDKETSVGLQ
ncbi:MAG: hypothetical protein ABJE79_00530 [Marinomonas sp.]